MKNFTIENETNNIPVHGSAKEAEAVPNSERFSTEAALTKLAALGIEIDGNDDLDEAGVAELIEKAVETGNAENLCPVCGSGPGVVCTCVHPDEREE